jgi:sugar phosphate isomerase/epimerase
MAILTHGSDLTLAPTVRPLVQQHHWSIRTAVERLAAEGFTSVQLDAALHGIRPRELTRRARRDLLALLSRANVRLAGLDLFLPRKHYVQNAYLDRATAATVAAIELAADLGRVPVSVGLPVASIEPSIKAALVQCADGRGVTLAVHAEDQLDALVQWITEVDLPVLGAGLDPATVLSLHSDSQLTDPAAAAHKLAKRLAVARLCDSNLALGRARCPVGQGDLDVVGYRVAMDLTGGRQGPVVLDLSGLESPLIAATIGKKTWEHAAFSI